MQRKFVEGEDGETDFQEPDARWAPGEFLVLDLGVAIPRVFIVQRNDDSFRLPEVDWVEEIDRVGSREDQRERKRWEHDLAEVVHYLRTQLLPLCSRKLLDPTM